MGIFTARPRARRTSLLAALIVGLTTVAAQPAHAVPTFHAPWDAGVRMAVGNPAGSGGGGFYGHNSYDYYAVDINKPNGADDCGMNVRAAAGGTVVYSAWDSGGGGNLIAINHGDGYLTVYQHLQDRSVSTGNTVTASQVIGHIGTTGNSTGCHLHFVLRSGAGSNPGPWSGTAIPPSPMSGVALVAPGSYVTSDNTPFPAAWGGVGGSSFYGSDTLPAGQQLNQNQYLLSTDRRFALLLQADGNLVLYSGTAIWSSGTSGATRLVMQTDGNLVLYNGNTPVWQSLTSGSGAAHLTIQSDGNLVVYNSSNGAPKWWTGTGGRGGTTAYGSAVLPAGNQLNASGSDYLGSADLRYALLMQSDGSIVLYGPGYHVLWAVQTPGATRLVMQADGNLVSYAVNTPLWFTGTGGTAMAHLTVQNDGNAVVYRDSDNAVLWQSATNGQI